MSKKNELVLSADFICNDFLRESTPAKEMLPIIQSALKITSLGIWKMDLITGVVCLSGEVFEMTGLDYETFDGTIEFIANHVIHPTFKETFNQSIQLDLQTQIAHTREFRINHPFLDEAWVRVSSEFVVDEQGTPVELVGTVLNISSDYMQKRQLIKELSFLETLLEASPSPIFYKDQFGIYRFCNQAFLTLLGYKEEDIINKTVYDVAPYELARIYENADQELLASRGHQTYEAKLKCFDGLYHDVIFNKAVHLNEQMQPQGIVGVIQDITEKKAMELQLKRLHEMKDAFLKINHRILTYQSEAELLADILQSVQSILPACDFSSVLQSENGMSFQIVTSIGYVQEDVSDFNLVLSDSVVWHHMDHESHQAFIINDILAYISSKDTEGYARTLSGKRVESSLIIPIEMNEQLKWIFSFDSSQNHSFTDIDRETADFIREEVPLLCQIFDLHQKNLYLSRYDNLTGLMTRSYYDLILDDRLYLAERQKTPLCIVLFDLDGLKAVNDTYGHAAGDLYLKAFSQLLCSHFRTSDTFSRIGGDEFVGIFSNTGPKELTPKLESLQTFFEALELSAGEVTFKGSFSFGTAVYPIESTDKTALLKLADERMYLNKAR